MRGAVMKMRKINITGDVHGYQDSLEEIVGTMERGDILIVAGDFGFGMFDDVSRSEKSFFDEINEKGVIILFCDGNHENFDELNALPVSEWCGGKVHKVRDNIMHLMRGEVYEIDGERIFVFGGGFSADLGINPFRVPGVAYWKEEMPSEEEYANGRRNLVKTGYRIDHIITHTLPEDTLSALRGFKDLPEERPLRYYLQHDVFDMLADTKRFIKEPKYKFWYFGHVHIDEELWRRQYALFKYVRDLRTGAIVYTRTKHVDKTHL